MIDINRLEPLKFSSGVVSSVSGKIEQGQLFCWLTLFFLRKNLCFKKIRNRHQSSGFLVRLITGNILSQFENELILKRNLLKTKYLIKTEVLSLRVHLCAGKVLRAPLVIC